MEENTAIEIENAKASIIRSAEGILENGIVPAVPIVGSFGSEISGDDGDNELIGDDRINIIVGNGGNDTIFGSSSTTAIDGGDGDDLINGNGGFFIGGGAGNDTIFSAGTSLGIIGGDGNDVINGSDDGELFFGDAGNDRLEGNGGDDRLSGGVGNDLIIGGSGNDIIAGVNIESVSSEPGEIDTLVGGAGSDLFWLGDAEDYLYDDGVQSGFPDFGTGDYALITDFTSEDVIQLNGSANQYITVATGFINPQIPGGTGIFRNEGGFLSSDLVGVVEGIDPSQLSLSDTTQFTYV